MAPNNPMPCHGNTLTMNLNTMILTNIQSSPYFKVKLYELKTYHEVIDEIYYKVDHMEPWEKGSRKTSGQTGMCGGVRGVGAGGIVSSAYCLLYKLYTLKLTANQVHGLISHSDSPYIRAIGFMYIRYTQHPSKLWEWYSPYLEDEEEIDVKAGGGHSLTIGELVRQWMVKIEWYSTLFPRIPVPIHKDYDQKLKEWEAEYLPQPEPEPEPEPEPQQQQQQQQEPNFGEAERISKTLPHSERPSADREGERSSDRPPRERAEPRDDRYRDDRRTDSKSRDDRRTDSKSRDDRPPREDRHREDRNREDRPRDDKHRDDRRRDDRTKSHNDDRSRSSRDDHRAQNGDRYKDDKHRDERSRYESDPREKERSHKKSHKRSRSKDRHDGASRDHDGHKKNRHSDERDKTRESSFERDLRREKKRIEKHRSRSDH